MRVVYEIGEKVGYPEWSVHGREVTIVDRQVIRYNRKSFFVRYLYEELVERLVEDMHTNIEREYDNVVVVDGPEGVGKSHLAYHICKCFDPGFDLETNYTYDFDRFIEKVTTGDYKGRVFWFDEATNVASAREWNSAQNIAFTQILEMIRARGLTLVMCIPLIDRLDKYIRETRLRYRLTAMEASWEVRRHKTRGYFELHFPTRRADGREFRTVGFGMFPKMPDDVERRYKELKEQSLQSKLEEKCEETKQRRTRTQYQKDKHAIAVLACELYKNGMSYNELSALTGMPYSTIKGHVWRAMNATGEDE